MNDSVISPWLDKVELQSPDGKFTAIYPEGWEIAMGAPTSGLLWLCSKNKKYKISNNAGASFIWSSDSRYLAYSEWTKEKMQIIRVIRISDKNDRCVKNEMSVIQFESFENNKIVGIDSPIYQPRRFTIDVNEIFDDR